MDQPLIQPQPPDPLLEETRAFWRETGKSLVRESIATIDETAKQIIGVAGVLEGLYFNAIAFSDLHGAIKNISLLSVYLAPIVLLLISLVFALLVFFPDQYKLNFNNGEASKLVYERLAADKLRALRAASIFLVVGIFTVGLAVLIYLVG